MRGRDELPQGRPGESRDDRNRRAVEEMVKANKETAERFGNTRATEREIRDYVVRIAERVDREERGR